MTFTDLHCWPEQAAGTSLTTNAHRGERRRRGGSYNSILNQLPFISGCFIISDVHWNISVHRGTLWICPFNKVPAVCLFLTPLHIINSLFSPAVFSSPHFLSSVPPCFSHSSLSFHFDVIIVNKSRGGPPPESSSHLVPAPSSEHKVTEVTPFFRWYILLTYHYSLWAISSCQSCRGIDSRLCGKVVNTIHLKSFFLSLV